MSKLVLIGFREAEKLHVVRPQRGRGRPVMLCGHVPPLWLPPTIYFEDEVEATEICQRCLKSAKKASS